MIDKNEIASEVNVIGVNNHISPDPNVKIISSDLTSLEKKTIDISNIISNQLLLDQHKFKEDKRIYKEIRSEQDLIDPESLSGESGWIEEFTRMILDATKRLTSNNGGGSSWGLAAGLGAAALYFGNQYFNDNNQPEVNQPPSQPPKTEQAPVPPTNRARARPDNRQKNPTKKPTTPRSRHKNANRAKPKSTPPVVKRSRSRPNDQRQTYAQRIASPNKGSSSTPIMSNNSGAEVKSGKAPDATKSSYMLTVFNEYKRLGLSEEGAKTMVAQINRENNFQEKELFGSHIDPHNKVSNVGMMSWQLDRGQRAYAYLKSKNLIDSNGKIIKGQEALKAQVQFSMMELKDPFYAKSLKALTDKSLKYKDIEAIVGDNYVRWRRNDPKYRRGGYINQNQGYAEINAILEESRMNIARSSINRAVNTANRILGFGKVEPDFASPIGNARLSSDFGDRDRPKAGASTNHQGLDFAVVVGTPVKSTKSGTVTFAGVQRGYGNIVIVDHGKGETSAYAHLSKIHVKVGQQVRQGEVIAKSGNSGNSTGPHLHFEIRKNGKAINPQSVLSGKISSNDSGKKVASLSNEVSSKKKLAQTVIIQNKTSSPSIQVAAKSAPKTKNTVRGASDKYRSVLA